MPEYEVDHFDKSDVDRSTCSIDYEFGVPIMKTPRVKKALVGTNEKVRCLTWEKNIVTQFGCDNYMAYHYAFVIKVVTIRELESFAEST